MARTGQLLVAICGAMVMIKLGHAISISKDSECGISKGCYHDCKQDGDCSFLISWRHVPEVGVVKFSMNKAVDNPYDFVWFAMGFSYDMYMGADSVLECTTDRYMYWLAGVRHSYNEQYYNVDFFNAELGLRETIGRMGDGVLQCNFTKQVRVQGVDRIYDLDRSWYLLVAHGYIRDGVKQRHSLHADFPHASPVMVDLRDHVDVSGKAIFYLIKIHGCLMVFAWMVMSSIAIVVARAFKQPLYTGTGTRSKKSHLTHKTLMICVFLCTLASFVVIWWSTKDFSRLRGSSIIQRAHPVLGVIIMGLTFINPLIAIFRPGSKASFTQPTFRYAHAFIGTVTFILAILNMIIGVTLPKSNAPSYVMWIMTGFAIYQVVLYTVLESHDLYLIRSGKLYAYETARTTRNEATAAQKDPPGMLVKQVAFGLHVTVSLAVGLFCVVILAM